MNSSFLRVQLQRRQAAISSLFQQSGQLLNLPESCWSRDSRLRIRVTCPLSCLTVFSSLKWESQPPDWSGATTWRAENALTGCWLRTCIPYCFNYTLRGTWWGSLCCAPISGPPDFLYFEMCTVCSLLSPLYVTCLSGALVSSSCSILPANYLFAVLCSLQWQWSLNCV